MSINSAMLAGVSGLITNSSALAAISDNISNLNTTAYKRNEVDFATAVTAQATGGQYSAGGVEGVVRQFATQQGLIQSASSPTDLAINGDGFFIVTQKGAGLTNTDQRLFTRAGAFSVDSNGYLVNDGGFYLQGWPAQANGTYNTSPSNLGLLQPINVKQLGTVVSPTTNIAVSGTLSSSDPTQPAAVLTAYDPTSSTTSLTTYAASNGASGTKPDFTMQLKVVDTQGGSHTVEVAFLKAGGGVWHAEAYAVPASDVVTASGVPAGQLASGDLTFDQNGSLTSNTLFSGTPPKLTINATDTTSASPATPRWSDALNVGGQTINFDLSKFQQLDGTSQVSSINADGSGPGNIIGVQVDKDGIVSAVFDNSQVKALAKIAIGTFANEDGLQAVTGNAYLPSMSAGTLVIKQPGIGAGQISPSSLEASTVDLSAEFTGLITTQKAYSASSKIITTADQMLDELIQIIR